MEAKSVYKKIIKKWPARKLAIYLELVNTWRRGLDNDMFKTPDTALYGVVLDEVIDRLNKDNNETKSKN